MEARCGLPTPRIVIASHAEGVARQSKNRTPLHSAERILPTNQIATVLCYTAQHLAMTIMGRARRGRECNPAPAPKQAAGTEVGREQSPAPTKLSPKIVIAREERKKPFLPWQSLPSNLSYQIATPPAKGRGLAMTILDGAG